MEYRSLGRIAFEAYKQQIGGKTYDGKPIPDWDKLGANVRTAWEAAASEVKNWLELQRIPPPGKV